MAERAWLSYTGAITGVIGAITGIAGAIMGYISYRRTQDLKALDLRLEVRKSENNLRGLVLGLPAHLEHAKKSRKAVAAAKGLWGSGANQKWIAEWETDTAAAHAMVARLPASSETYATLDHTALEDKLVATHAALRSAQQLHAKYAGYLAADDKDRDHIKEDVRVNTQVLSFKLF